MQKYHKQIGFYPCHEAEAKALIMALKWRKIGFSFHALHSLQDEAQAVEIGQFLFNYNLNFDDVFELVIDAGIIQKIGFRVNFGELDIVFILNREKQIITLWTNKKEDKHFTLNKNKYNKILSHSF